MENKKKFKNNLNIHQETQRTEVYKNLSFTVVLIRPEHAGNIGSIARVMKNFNFKKLIIFNPIESKENIFSYETQGFAMSGSEIFKNTEIIELDSQENHILEFGKLVNKFDLVIATTAKGKKFNNLRRLAQFPEDLKLPTSENPLEIAILFGKESQGLTNEEISLTDIVLRIPTGNDYPTLNLSHACGIILYEIFNKINKVSIGRGKNPVLLASRENRQSLLKIVEKVIEVLNIGTHKKENVYFAFRNVFERAFMSRKELTLITGIFSKVGNILEDVQPYEN